MVDTSVDAHVVVDVQGYISTPGAATSTFTPTVPRRIADSRRAVGLRTFAAGSVQSLDVRARAALPADATAVIANLTVARATAPPYVTGWSGAGARPVVSSVNATTGQLVANRVLLPLAADGHASLFNAAGSTDLVVDVVGYVSSSSTGSYFVLSPGARLADVRTTGTVVRATLDPSLPDRGRAPAVTDVSPTTAVWLTVVGDTPAGAGYLAVRPAGTAVTGTSDLNLVAGRSISNSGPVAVSADGSVAVLSSPSSRVVVDLFGWFQRDRPSPPPAGVYTTRDAAVATQRSVLPGSLLPSEVGGVFTGPDRAGTTHDTFLRSGGTVWQKGLAHPYEPFTGDWGPAARVGSLTGIVQLAGYGLPDDTAVYARGGGRVWASGTNRYGELGAAPTSTTTPVAPQEVDLPGDAQLVGAATAVGYAVVDGTLYSWGRASHQLGRDSTTSPWVPAPVAGPTGVVAVAGDNRLTVAVDGAGHTWYWGDPLGDPVPVTAPRELLGSSCPQVASLQADPSGVREVCADGTAVLLSDMGEFRPQTLPVTGVRQITSGGYYAVRVLLDDGRVADLSRDAQLRYSGARYEPVLAGVSAIAGVSEVQVATVGP